MPVKGSFKERSRQEPKPPEFHAGWKSTHVVANEVCAALFRPDLTQAADNLLEKYARKLPEDAATSLIIAIVPAASFVAGNFIKISPEFEEKIKAWLKEKLKQKIKTPAERKK